MLASGVCSVPCPVNSGTATVWPCLRRLSATASQHHAPNHAPCTSTKFIIFPFRCSCCRQLRDVGPHALVLRVALKRLMALLAAIARHLVAAERRVGVIPMPGVEPDRPSLNAICKAKSSCEIPRLNAGGQTIRGVIGNANCFLFACEPNNWNHWTEDFLARDLHVIGRVRKNRGLNEQALAIDLAAVSASR